MESSLLFLPEIRTHKHNIPFGKSAPNAKQYSSEILLKKSLFTAGRKELIQSCILDLSSVYKNNLNVYISLRGIMGSGKSLFVRKVFADFLEANKELKGKQQ